MNLKSLTSLQEKQSTPNSSWIQRNDPLHLQEMLANRSKRCNLATDDMGSDLQGLETWLFLLVPHKKRIKGKLSYGCYSVTFLNWKPIFDWCVVTQGSKNACSKEIGLCFQILLTTPHSTMNIIEWTYAFSKRLINMHNPPITIT